MHIGLLGEFELTGPDGIHKLSPLCRSILSALALHANESMSTQRLTAWAWNDGDYPRRPSSALHTHVCRIRACLGEEARALRTLSDGYILDLKPTSVDALRFEEEVTRTLAVAAGTVDVQSIDDALTLWRGVPLADVPLTDAVTAERLRLDELRLRATEVKNEELLRDGLAGDVIGDLQTLVHENPYHERFIRQLLTAMMQLDRRADALARYQLVYRKFRDELGIEPSQEIRDLHQALLAPDPPRSGRDARSGQDDPARTDGRLSGLAGVRDEQVESLPPPTLRAARSLTPVTIVTGEPGAGCTTAALRYATKYRGTFPGGIHFVDATASGFPASWTGQAGGPAPARKPGPRMVILDGVASMDQIRPWLVAEADHLIVTTTRHLSGLPQSREVTLDPLSADAATAALRATVGAARFAAESSRLTEAIQMCEGNVLALAVIAASITEPPPGDLNQLTRTVHAGTGAFVAHLSFGGLNVADSFRRALSACRNEELRILRAVARAEQATPWPAEQVARSAKSDLLLVHRALRGLAERHLVRVSRERGGEPHFYVPLLCAGALSLAPRLPEMLYAAIEISS